MNTRARPALLLAAALSLLPLAAGAQRMYQCGNSFSDRPCPGAQERPMQPLPPMNSGDNTRSDHNAARASARPRRAQPPARTPRASQPSAQQSPSAPAECQRLRKRLDALQSQARAGGNARRMEKLNEDRRRLHAEQSRLGCR